jgi:hypothetical protein
MRYSGDSVRWAIALALILIGLLNTPGGVTRARRQARLTGHTSCYPPDE